MRKIAVVMILVLAISSIAQNISYGISGMVNSSRVGGSTQAKDLGLTNGINVGGNIWSAYRINHFSPYVKLGYRNLVYSSDITNFKVQSSAVTSSLGVKYHFEKAPSVNLLFAMENLFSLSNKSIFLGKSDSIPNQDLKGNFKNPNAFALSAGLEFNFNNNNSIETRYVHILNQQYTGSYIDALPHHFTVEYNFNFTKGKEGNNVREEMQKSLTLLQSDTLYFINRSCSSDFTNEQLDSLLEEHYTFSAAKVLTSDELQNTTRPNALFYAVIGSYTASAGDPQTIGIFLLDKHLMNTTYPYPYHTGSLLTNDGKSTCIGSLQAAALIIRNFNIRLGTR